ncbi:MAG: aminomethyltransferase family protein [Actinomycetota bacterium]
MSVGTAFFERTAPLNRKLAWSEWSGYHAASSYADHHDIEYNAIREGAALLDVSPLYKYRITGRDAVQLIDRVITRDATKLAVGRVIYTPWCDEAGKVIDDGTVARLDETSYRLTAADPSYRWLSLNAAGLEVTVEDISESVAALALQGPRTRALLEDASQEDLSELRYFGRRTLEIAGIGVDVSRTGYTGDLGYELWVDSGRALDLWDALIDAGRAHSLRPTGLMALDVARLEAGLILIEADFVSARHALIAEQLYSPYEIGLGRLVNFNKGAFVGRRALEAEVADGGPARRLVGLEIDWEQMASLYERRGLPPEVPAHAWRIAVPLYDGNRRVGKATSGTWSPALKRNIALGSVSPRFEKPGSRLGIEWTVEAQRHQVAAEVVPLPFFDPPRKRA